MIYKSDGILLDQQEVQGLPKSNKCPFCGRRKLSNRPCQSKLISKKDKLVLSVIHSVKKMLNRKKVLSSFTDYRDGYNHAVSDVVELLEKRLKK